MIVVVRYFIALFLVLLPSQAFSLVLTTDTVWSGEVLVTDDVLIPEGVTLTVQAGALIRVSVSDSTKTDPEYLSPLTEITVRGTLRVIGTSRAPIRFFSTDSSIPTQWAGILVDGGTAEVRSSLIQNGETGIQVYRGSVSLRDCTIEKNRYGIVLSAADARASIRNSTVRENDYGVLLLNGAKADTAGSSIGKNRKQDTLSPVMQDFTPISASASEPSLQATRVYSDEALPGDTIWQGRIIVKGVLRVPADGRLIILPGTVIEFSRRDTNGDGIGENGLLIQGVLLAKGSSQSPITFRSADGRMGGWDAVNIMNSDGALNIVEHCRIEDAYRGLHFHFANVAVRQTVLRNNYRGIQFQESGVEIRDSLFSGNKSGLQARDSEILLENNQFEKNYSGANILRSAVTVRRNVFTGHVREGIRIREGAPVIEENLIKGNRFGLLIADADRGSFARNVIMHNAESGIAVKGTDNVEIASNFIQASGVSGLMIQDSRATVRANHISGNGERGIGIVSFDGVISENTFTGNGRYAVDLEGAQNVSAPDNWWGSEPGAVICDGLDEPGRGRVEYFSQRSQPVPYNWPLAMISTDTAWAGEIHVAGQVAVRKGVVLSVAPGTRVSFREGAGLSVSGKIIAQGTSGERIVFSADAKTEPQSWGEILLDHAAGSRFAFCDFKYATWGLHSHFTNLSVEQCRFSGNYGGLRFRSGPVNIRHSVFQDNYIGIRAYRGTAGISGNVIARNEIGLFVREKGGSLAIRNNNFNANIGYGIRLGDFNDEDVDARENWWGGSEPADAIFDHAREPGIGKVLYQPVRPSPVQLPEEKP